MPQSHSQSLIPSSSAAATLTNTTNTSASSSTHHHHHQQQQPHTIGPQHRAEINVWLEEHGTDIGGLVFIFVFLLLLGGLWNSRDAIMQWYFERRSEQEKTAWVEREMKRRRTVVVVGILRKGSEKRTGRRGEGVGVGAGCGCAGGKGKVLKRVRFLDGLDETIVVVDEPEQRTELLIDFLEDGRVVGEVF